MISIFSMKGKTKHAGIKPLAEPDVLCVPLLQHIGRPAEPLVKTGDRVLKYQLIGRAVQGLSANVHSPVSGVVSDVTTTMIAGGRSVPAITIKNDHQSITCDPFGDVGGKSVDDIIRAAGIVGEGGAQFPTDVKYDVGDRPIHTLIINGTECEPYLTADYALMAERTEDILKGIRIVNSVLRADEVVLVIERHNRELAEVFGKYLDAGRYDVRIQLLPDTYPQGGELQVIKSVTGMELPKTTLPKDAGVIVSNVATVYSVYQAVEKHIPLTSRVMTVSGERSKNYGNYEVCIGTPMGHLLEQLALEVDGVEMVMGGPMMGKPIDNIDTPMIKGTSGLLLLNPRDCQEGHCISCGYCVEACPMHLMPMAFAELWRKGRVKTMAKRGLMTCIECAACEYACPANVALVRSIKEGKNKLRELSDASK